MPTSQTDPVDSSPILEATDIQAGYGQMLIVRDTSVRVNAGSLVAIIGPNGSGKSTLLKTLAGELTPRGGRIKFASRDVTGMRQDRLARLGVAYVRQEKELFPSLSVHDNLRLGGYILRKKQVEPAIEQVFVRFPILAARSKTMAGNLSGGERKMLSIGRVLMTSPRLVLLDEPSAGLSPIASAQLLNEHVPSLTQDGTAVLIVEQRALQVLKHADWAYVMGAGTVLRSGRGLDLLQSDSLVATLLGQSQTDGTGGAQLS